MIKKLLLLCFALPAVQNVLGQNLMMKNQFSNYGGFFAALNNPARAANSAHTFHSNGFAYGLEINNNYINLDAPFSLWSYLRKNVPEEYKGSDGKIAWDPAWFSENLNGSPKFAQLNAVTQGPSFLFSYKKWGFAIGTANHTNLRIFNVAEPLARLIRLNQFSLDALKDSDGVNIIDNNFAVVANSYQEISSSFGFMAVDKESIKLRVGVGFRYLLGLGYGEFNNEGINMQFYDQDSVVLRNANFNAAYANPSLFDNFRSDILNLNTAGSGYAFNVGASFEWNPDAFNILFKPERYKFRVGACLSNIGAITYNKDVRQYSATLNQPVLLNFTDTSFINSFISSNENGIDYLDSLVRNNMTLTETTGSMKVNLPYNLQLDFDWNVYKGFYLGVIPNIAINSSGKFSFKNLTSYTFLPRFESRFIEASLPLIYTQGLKKLQMGAMIRLGPLFFGTNDLGFITRSEPINNVGFYFGLSAGLLRKSQNSDNKENY